MYLNYLGESMSPIALLLSLCTTSFTQNVDFCCLLYLITLNVRAHEMFGDD